MFSVVSRWTSESSSQGWFFSCQARSVSRATKGGAGEGDDWSVQARAHSITPTFQLPLLENPGQWWPRETRHPNVKQKHRLEEGIELLPKISPGEVYGIVGRELDLELRALVVRPRSATNYNLESLLVPSEPQFPYVKEVTAIDLIGLTGS